MFDYNKIITAFRDICQEAGLDLSKIEKKMEDVGLGKVDTPFVLAPSTVKILFRQEIQDQSKADELSKKFNDVFEKELSASYQDKYIAWLDILGFKDAVQDEKGIEYLSKYTDIFSVINQHKNEHESIWLKLLEEGAKCQFKIFFINDGIIFIADEIAKEALFAEMNNILCKGYYDNVYIRGAITKGKVFIYDNVVYGKGIITAYEMEKAAKFPRVIIDKAIQSDCQYSKVDEDDATYFDYFSNTSGFAHGIFGEDANAFVDKKCKYFETIIADPSVKPDIRDKYSYLKRKLDGIKKSLMKGKQ